MGRFRARLVVLFVALALLAAPAAAGAAAGFNGPLFGLARGPGHSLLVADASVGIHMLRGDSVATTFPLPGVTDVSALSRRALWATTSGDNPEEDTGQALYRVTASGARLVANLFEVEATANPDGKDPFDSNPFDVESLGRHAALVVDAGGNDLLKVNKKGRVKVLAVFPDELASTENAKSLVGCPTPPVPDFEEICNLPPMIPAEAVPTSVAVGPDGHYYVGELKGFPAPTDASNIWRVAPDAHWEQCPSAKCVKVFEGGFTSIIDLAFGPRGKLYVAEMDEASWAAVEILQDGVGGTISKCNVRTLRCQEVAGDIPQLTAITFLKRRALYATQNSLIPGAAEVIRVR